MRDTFVSLNSREVGECIYCGRQEEKLTTEHAIPYGLNGPWTLVRASCDACARITTRFEHDVMRNLWPDVRNALAMQIRRPHRRNAMLPLILQREGGTEEIRVPREKFPTYLTLPLFPKPGVLWTDRMIPGIFTNATTLHLCGPTHKQVSELHPGCTFLGSRTSFAPDSFARMIAKIGYCAAIAVVGLGAFKNTPIRNIILGIDPCVGHWVGSWWGEPFNGSGKGLHEMRILQAQPGNIIHAFVRLFAQFGAQEYHVILGPADPEYVASEQWPKQWAGKNESTDLLHV